jgi:hypothetical protein
MKLSYEEFIEKYGEVKMNRYLLTFYSGHSDGKSFTEEIEALNAADAIAQGKLRHERTSPQPQLAKCEPVKPYKITYYAGKTEEQINHFQVSAHNQPFQLIAKMYAIIETQNAAIWNKISGKEKEANRLVERLTPQIELLNKQLEDLVQATGEKSND